ncbi:MAG: hypothetical protein WD688_10310 [Candidatus Binatia bacterium]
MAASKEQVVLGQLEGENTEEKIELILHRSEAESNLQVRALRWAEGIGWFVQKTITLDSTQVKNLARLLRQAPVGNRRENKGKGDVVDLTIWKSRGSDVLS